MQVAHRPKSTNGRIRAEFADFIGEVTTIEGRVSANGVIDSTFGQLRCQYGVAGPEYGLAGVQPEKSA
jgi:hypothetical protein